MRTILAFAAAFAFCCGAGASIVHAQKGTGAATGVAQQVAKPKVTSISGTIREIETGPCQATTGRASVGTHLVIETAKGEKLNIHLGPTAAVKHIADRLTTGDAVTINVFRTDRMTEGHFVAQSIALGEKSVQLRDGNLRPAWAGSGATWWGRGGPQPGAGYGRGWGAEGGRGAYPGWSDTPSGRGPGWGAPGRGRGGYGRGYGQGNGRGYGQGAGRGYGRGYGQGYGCWWAEEPNIETNNVQDKVK